MGSACLPGTARRRVRRQRPCRERSRRAEIFERRARDDPGPAGRRLYNGAELLQAGAVVFAGLVDRQPAGHRYREGRGQHPGPGRSRPGVVGGVRRPAADRAGAARRRVEPGRAGGRYPARGKPGAVRGYAGGPISAGARQRLVHPRAAEQERRDLADQRRLRIGQQLARRAVERSGRHHGRPAQHHPDRAVRSVPDRVRRLVGAGFVGPGAPRSRKRAGAGA